MISAPTLSTEQRVLLAIEWSNFSEFLTGTIAPEALQRALFKALVGYVEQQAATVPGLSVSCAVNPNAPVMFMDLGHEMTLVDAARAAVELGLKLLAREIRLEGRLVVLKIGGDVHNPKTPNPLATIAERSVAEPSSLCVSEPMLQLLGTQNYDVSVRTGLQGPMGQGVRAFTIRHGQTSAHAMSGPPITSAPPSVHIEGLEGVTPIAQPQPITRDGFPVASPHVGLNNPPPPPSPVGGFALEVSPVAPAPLPQPQPLTMAAPSETPVQMAGAVGSTAPVVPDASLPTFSTEAWQGLPTLDEFPEISLVTESVQKTVPTPPDHDLGPALEASHDRSSLDVPPPEGFLTAVAPMGPEDYREEPSPASPSEAFDVDTLPHAVAGDVADPSHPSVPWRVWLASCRAVVEGDNTDPLDTPFFTETPKLSPSGLTRFDRNTLTTFLEEGFSSFMNGAQGGAVVETDTPVGTPVGAKVYFIQGPDGIGKTTLLTHIRAQAEQVGHYPSGALLNASAVWLGCSGRVLFQKTRVPLGAWFDLLCNWVGVTADSASCDEVGARLIELHQWMFGPQADAPQAKQLFQWLQQAFLLQDPGTVDQWLHEPGMTLLEALTLMLEATLRKAPVVLCFDDIQWLDDASMRLLAQVLKRFRSHPRLMVLLAGNNAFSWAPAGEALLRDMGAVSCWLDAASASELKDVYQGSPLGAQLPVPEDVFHLVASYTQGSVFYQEEVFRYLFQLQFFRLDPPTGLWELTPGYDWRQMRALLPSTATLIPLQRLGALSDASHEILRWLAIAGGRLAVASLVHLLQTDEATCQQRLEELWDQGWVAPDGAGNLIFRHPALESTVYGAIPPHIRTQAHHLFLQYLEAGLEKQQLTDFSRLVHQATLAQDNERLLLMMNRLVLYLTCVHGETAAAVKLLKSHLPLLHEEPSLHGVAARLHWLMIRLEARMSPASALEHLHQVMPRLESSLMPNELLRVRQLQIRLQEQLGYPYHAVQLIDQTLTQLEGSPQTGDQVSTWLFKLQKFDNLVRAGYWEAAHSLFRFELRPEAQEFMTLEGPWSHALWMGWGRGLLTQATLLMEQGHFHQAEDQLGTLTKHLQQKPNEMGLQVEARLVFARLAMLRGRFQQAEKELNLMLQMLEHTPNHRLIVSWYVTRLSLLQMQGNWSGMGLMLHQTFECLKDYQDNHQWVGEDLRLWTTALHCLLTWLTEAGPQELHHEATLEELLSGCLGTLTSIQQGLMRRGLLGLWLQGVKQMGKLANMATLHQVEGPYVEQFQAMAGQAEGLTQRQDVASDYHLCAIRLLEAAEFLAANNVEKAGRLLESTWSKLTTVETGLYQVVACQLIVMLYQRLSEQAPGLEQKTHYEAKRQRFEGKLSECLARVDCRPPYPSQATGIIGMQWAAA